jgi:hypothetical protein
VGASGLTAVIVTVHTPALALAAGVAGVSLALVALLLRRRPATARAAWGIAWALGIGIAAYAGLCAAQGVRGLDVETVSVSS